MKKALDLTKEHFESSSGKTPEYKAWHSTFRRAFTKFLSARGVAEIEFSPPNHFDLNGFFRRTDGQAFYFSISDLRWAKDNMLIRTAQDFKDYTGGQNQFINLKSVPSFISDFNKIVKI